MKSAEATTVRRRRCSWIHKGFAALLLVGVAMSSSFRADAFSAASSPKQWLVVDFDETCTVRGTTSMLPRLAALAQSKLPGSQNVRELSPDASIEFQSRLSIWSILEDEYFRKYSETLQSILDGEKEDGQEQVTNLEELAKSIDLLDDVSTEITNEVSKWRVLGGLGDVSDTDMVQLVDLYKERQATLEPKTIGSKTINQQELLECFDLQPGCLSVLQRSALSKQYGIGVLSINWCPAVIQALLVRPLCDAAAAAGDDDDDQEPSLGANDVSIWCNSVDGEGIVDLPVPGAISKQDQIRKLQEQEERVVYVGDSLTDLLAILQADVGILLGGSQSAVNMAQRYGVVVKPLSDFDSDADATVWKADNWDEIGSFLDSVP